MSTINDYDAKWFYENSVDPSNVLEAVNPNENKVTAMLVIINLKEWFQCP